MQGVPYIGVLPPARDCVVPPGALVLTFKYCELCRELFVTDSEEAKAPGYYVSMQRGAGRRHPIVCKRCSTRALDPSFLAEEAEEMQRIAREIRSERNAMQKASPLRFPTVQRTESCRRARNKWAKWRGPLAEAFKSKGELTAREIAALLGVITISGHSAQAAVYRAKYSGFDITVVRREKVAVAGRIRTICYYGLSTGAPLTPPQDTVTHQFMRPVVEEQPAV